MPTRRVSRRSLLRLLGASAAATLLAACQPKVVEVTKLVEVEKEKEVTKVVEKEVTKVVEKEKEVAKVVEKVVTATPAKDKIAGKITVSIIGATGPEREVARDRLGSAYKDLHPNVEIKWLGPPEGGDYTTWLGTMLAAEPVELDICSGNYQVGYGKYVDFDKYRKAINPYTGNKWDEDLDFDFGVFRSGAGLRYLLSTRAVHTCYFYNKEIFKQVGINPPKTWPELVDVCTKLQQAGFTPMSLDFYTRLTLWFGDDYLDQFYRNERYEFGRALEGDWCYVPATDGQYKYDPKDPNGNGAYTFNYQRWLRNLRDGKVRLDGDEMVTILKHWTEVWPQFATKDLYVISDVYVPFLQQQVAMTYDGTWTIPTLLKDMKTIDEARREQLKVGADVKIKPFEWGTFDTPGMVDDLVDGPVRTTEVGVGEYVSVIQKAQAQTDMALDFLYFWLSPRGYQHWLDGLYLKNYSPDGPLMVRGVKDPSEYAETFKNLKMIGNSGVNPYWHFWRVGEYRGPEHEEVLEMTKNVLDRKMTPVDFAKKLQAMYKDERIWPTALKALMLSPADIDHPERKPGA